MFNTARKSDRRPRAQSKPSWLYTGLYLLGLTNLTAPLSVQKELESTEKAAEKVRGNKPVFYIGAIAMIGYFATTLPLMDLLENVFVTLGWR